MVWAPIASNVYHDWLWYPLVGRSRIREFRRTKWGRFMDERYRPGGPGPVHVDSPEQARAKS